MHVLLPLVLWYWTYMYIYCLKCMNPSSDSSTVNRATLDSNNSVNKDWGQLHWILIIEVLQCMRRWFSKLIQGRSSAKLQVRIHSILLSLLGDTSSYNHALPESWEIFLQCKTKLLHVHSVCCKERFLHHWLQYCILSSACSYSSPWWNWVMYRYIVAMTHEHFSCSNWA